MNMKRRRVSIFLSWENVVLTTDFDALVFRITGSGYIILSHSRLMHNLCLLILLSVKLKN